MNIRKATDKAQYVEWLNDYTFAVYHGGHTVNFYSFDPNTGNVEPTTCKNVGSFENDSASLQEVKDAIKREKEENSC